MPIFHLPESQSFVLFFKLEGHVSHKEFQEKLIPEMHRTLHEKDNQLRVLLDIRESDASLSTIAREVLWKEIKHALSDHYFNFDRLAIVGVDEWSKEVVNFFNWEKYYVDHLSPIISALFMNCTMKYFLTSAEGPIPLEAIDWIFEATGLPYFSLPSTSPSLPPPSLPIVVDNHGDEFEINEPPLDNNNNNNNNNDLRDSGGNSSNSSSSPSMLKSSSSLSEKTIKEIKSSMLPQNAIHWVVAMDEHEESFAALKTAITLVLKQQQEQHLQKEELQSSSSSSSPHHQSISDLQITDDNEGGDNKNNDNGGNNDNNSKRCSNSNDGNGGDEDGDAKLQTSQSQYHTHILHIIIVYFENDLYMDYMLGEHPLKYILEQINESTKELENVEVHTIRAPRSEKSPGPIVVDFLTKLPANYVVVGRRGVGTLSKYVLGSTSSYIVEHSPCPVIICNKHSK